MIELQDDGEFSPGNNLMLAEPVEDEKSSERKKQLWWLEKGKYSLDLHKRGGN